MASKDYTLNWSDDSLKSPFVLYHTTIDKSTTSLDLTGKDSALWGECIQEDLLRLLENFASHGTPPRAPTIGQFWYNADTGVLGIWNGSIWYPVYNPIPAPAWITPESISYTSGTPFTFQASNATTYNVVSGSIPGATFTNDVLSGISTPGTYSLTVRATGAGGFTDRTFNVTVIAVTTTTTTTTTTVAPVIYKPTIRFVPSTLQLDPQARTGTSYQIEVIGMKPNGYFSFDIGDFVNGTKGGSGWYTQKNLQADANGHWSRTLTLYGDGNAHPAGTEGYMRISDFNSRETNVITPKDDVFMNVKLI